MEHPCFMVIDPNDRVKVMAAHGMVLSATGYRTAAVLSSDLSCPSVLIGMLRLASVHQGLDCRSTCVCPKLRPC
jgi:hypothetical protein